MEEKIVLSWEKNKDSLKELIEEKLRVDSETQRTTDIGYEDLVIMMGKTILKGTSTYGRDWDYSRLTEIDDGDYQGTLLFVLPEEGYQPDNYLAIKVSYGSCSACDTLQGILYYDKDKADGLMTLCLHMIQSAKVV